MHKRGTCSTALVWSKLIIRTVLQTIDVYLVGKFIISTGNNGSRWEYIVLREALFGG